jgi:hypothetical protein
MIGRPQNILDRLEDLRRQASTEHSHSYVAKWSEAAIVEIRRLREALEDICSASHGDEARAIAEKALKRWK